MKYITDLHIHGKYARATSKDLTFETLEKYGRIKGIDVLGTGDFTHPKWFDDIKSKLTENSQGILTTSSGFPFILQTELALVYSQDGKGRRIHYLILAPSIEVAQQITDFLKTKGRVDYDGRPIFGMTSIELVEKLNEISEWIELIPAHAWTPWMSIFGSMSGFDSIKDCFKEKSHKIHAIETGMSSDPAMNWRISALDKITLISNSDCHSYWPWRLGREANVFDLRELSYFDIIKAIRTKENLVETIEVDPNYGKYHFTGHAACKVCLSPQQSIAISDICPQCKKKLTVGVLQRVEKLADRPAGFIPKNAVPFKTLIPLSDILAALLKKGIATKETWRVYNLLLEKYGNEFNVLLDADFDSLRQVVDPKIAQAIIDNRFGKIEVKPGYDGEYGVPFFLGASEIERKVKVSNKKVEESDSRIKKQSGLSDYF